MLPIDVTTLVDLDVYEYTTTVKQSWKYIHSVDRVNPFLIMITKSLPSIVNETNTQLLGPTCFFFIVSHIHMQELSELVGLRQKIRANRKENVPLPFYMIHLALERFNIRLKLNLIPRVHAH